MTDRIGPVAREMEGYSLDGLVGEGREERPSQGLVVVDSRVFVGCHLCLYDACARRTHLSEASQARKREIGTCLLMVLFVLASRRKDRVFVSLCPNLNDAVLIQIMCSQLGQVSSTVVCRSILRRLIWKGIVEGT
jgi:Fe-S-cluster-containing dehydrogenase component